MGAKLLQGARRPGPGRRRPGVSPYRVFMAIVFACIVLVDQWSDQKLVASAGADIIGTVSVIVWVLTLLGGFGVGPVATIWDAMRR